MEVVTAAAWRRGRELLEELRPSGPRTEALAGRLRAVTVALTPEDPYAWLACVLGLHSMNEGNYGVGAVVVRDGSVIGEGRNQLLRPRVNTAAHAEAQALDDVESSFPDTGSSGLGLTMYTSLECCPMCTVRLLNSGLRTVRYLAPDPDGGMLSRMDGLPPYWRRLSDGRTPPQTFERSGCAPALTRLAADIFAATETRLNEEIASS